MAKKYLLDSNIVSDLFNTDSINHKPIWLKIVSLDENDAIFVSVLTLYEFEYGHANAPEEKRSLMQKRIEKTKANIPILPLTAESSPIFGKLKKSLKTYQENQTGQKSNKEDMKKHNTDLILASTAIVESYTLVSSDKLYNTLSKLQPDFHYEDWAV